MKKYIYKIFIILFLIANILINTCYADDIEIEQDETIAADIKEKLFFRGERPAYGEQIIHYDSSGSSRYRNPFPQDGHQQGQIYGSAGGVRVEYGQVHYPDKGRHIGDDRGASVVGHDRYGHRQCRCRP